MVTWRIVSPSDLHTLDREAAADDRPHKQDATENPLPGGVAGVPPLKDADGVPKDTAAVITTVVVWVSGVRGRVVWTDTLPTPNNRGMANACAAFAHVAAAASGHYTIDYTTIAPSTKPTLPCGECECPAGVFWTVDINDGQANEPATADRATRKYTEANAHAPNTTIAFDHTFTRGPAFGHNPPPLCKSPMECMKLISMCAQGICQCDAPTRTMVISISDAASPKQVCTLVFSRTKRRRGIRVHMRIRKADGLASASVAHELKDRQGKWDISMVTQLGMHTVVPVANKDSINRGAMSHRDCCDRHGNMSDTTQDIEPEKAGSVGVSTGAIDQRPGQNQCCGIIGWKENRDLVGLVVYMYMPPGMRMLFACRKFGFSWSVASSPNTAKEEAQQPDMVQHSNTSCEGVKRSSACIDITDPPINDGANSMEPPAHRATMEPPAHREAKPLCKVRAGAPVTRVAVGGTRAPDHPVHAGAAGDHLATPMAQAYTHVNNVWNGDCTTMPRLGQRHKWVAGRQLEQRCHTAGMTAQHLCCEVAAIAPTVGAVRAEARTVRKGLPSHLEVRMDCVRCLLVTVWDIPRCWDVTTPPSGADHNLTRMCCKRDEGKCHGNNIDCACMYTLHSTVPWNFRGKLFPSACSQTLMFPLLRAYLVQGEWSPLSVYTLVTHSMCGAEVTRALRVENDQKQQRRIHMMAQGRTAEGQCKACYTRHVNHRADPTAMTDSFHPGKCLTYTRAGMQKGHEGHSAENDRDHDNENSAKLRLRAHEYDKLHNTAVGKRYTIGGVLHVAPTTRTGCLAMAHTRDTQPPMRDPGSSEVFGCTQSKIALSWDTRPPAVCMYAPDRPHAGTCPCGIWPPRRRLLEWGADALNVTAFCTLGVRAGRHHHGSKKHHECLRNITAVARKETQDVRPTPHNALHNSRHADREPHRAYRVPLLPPTEQQPTVAMLSAKQRVREERTGLHVCAVSPAAREGLFIGHSHLSDTHTRLASCSVVSGETKKIAGTTHTIRKQLGMWAYCGHVARRVSHPPAIDLVEIHVGTLDAPETAVEVRSSLDQSATEVVKAAPDAEKAADTTHPAGVRCTTWDPVDIGSKGGGVKPHNKLRYQADNATGRPTIREAGDAVCSTFEDGDEYTNMYEIMTCDINLDQKAGKQISGMGKGDDMYNKDAFAELRRQHECRVRVEAREEERGTPTGTIRQLPQSHTTITLTVGAVRRGAQSTMCTFALANALPERPGSRPAVTKDTLRMGKDVKHIPLNAKEALSSPGSVDWQRPTTNEPHQMRKFGLWETVPRHHAERHISMSCTFKCKSRGSWIPVLHMDIHVCVGDCIVAYPDPAQWERVEAKILRRFRVGPTRTTDLSWRLGMAAGRLESESIKLQQHNTLYFEATIDPSKMGKYHHINVHMSLNTTCLLCKADAHNQETRFGDTHVGKEARALHTGVYYTWALRVLHLANFTRKQHVLALSTAEAGYCAVANATKEAIWERRMLFEMGIVKACVPPPDGVQACTMMVRQRATPNKTGYLDIKYGEINAHSCTRHHRDHLGGRNMQINSANNQLAGTITMPFTQQRTCTAARLLSQTDRSQKKKKAVHSPLSGRVRVGAASGSSRRRSTVRQQGSCTPLCVQTGQVRQCAINGQTDQAVTGSAPSRGAEGKREGKLAA